MALELDFGRLETAADRPLGPDERETVQIAAHALLAILCGTKPPTWKQWERISPDRVRWWTDRPTRRVPRGPHALEDLAQLVLFLQPLLGVGRYTVTDAEADDGAGRRSRNTYSGRFVGFVSELVRQMGPHAPDGVFPADVGRFVKHVLEAQRSPKGRAQ